MKIGIIGGGMMGANLGALWARAGHEILLSSRHPESLESKVREMVGSAHAVTVEEAMRQGEVIFLAVPFAAVEDLGEAHAAAIEGKVILDAGNVFRQRDGDLALKIKHDGRGSGRFVADCFPGAMVVKAYNTIFWKTLLMEAHRSGEQVGVPLAADHEEAFAVAEQLVRDSGFEPFRVGGLDQGVLLEPGSEVWNSEFTVAQIRASLELD
ncbi:MAG: NAD(P)-binding domain-containing protein [Deltaproteobacteria bacterium]|nr:NAD(P)-binding domain-containing protein [Deltaproteobacteria bacterium]